MIYEKAFENECEKIIANLSTSDIVSANIVVNLVIKTSKKYPMLFLPTFLEDFIEGMSGSKIIRKYEMLNFNNLTSFVTSLKMKSRQYTDSDLSAKEQNLQDLGQRKRYEFLYKYTYLLYGPLENLLNYNILKTFVCYSVLKHTFITSENLQAYIMDAYSTTKGKIPVLSNKDRIDSFEKYIHDDIYMKINDIVSNLYEQGHVIVRDGDVSVTSEYPKFIEFVYDILRNEKNGIRYATFQRRVLDKFQLFRLAMPSVNVFENILDTLESKNLLIRKKTFWKYSPSNDHLFTMENYDSMFAKISKQRIESGRVKFFGRKIGPTLFLDELKSLEYGDLGDEDDQVTRIAGLVLSDAAMLQSPRENMESFDFVVDLKNYTFRPEQEEIMKKLDFKINSNIIHCKVMINRKVNAPLLTNLAAALPTGEQGVIFTCVPTSRNVSDIIANDKTIQIINEDAILDWCKITPVLPCRKNSLARIRYGDNVQKIVLTKSLNYESGLATVETALDGQEILIPIGSMEELLPNVSSMDDFEMVSRVYLEFLQLLADVSFGSLEENLTTEIIAVYDEFLHLKKTTNPELFDEYTGKYLGPVYDVPSYNPKYVQFRNLHAEIKISTSLDFSKCKCGHLLNQGSHQTLCPHLVAGLDHLCKRAGDAETIRQNTAMLKTALSKFRFANMKRSIEALSFALGSENHLLKSYLMMHQSSST